MELLVVLIIGSKPGLATCRFQCIVLNSESPSFFPVLSGVPQSTVLGPLMFLLYITKGIISPLHLFADDCLLYRVIYGVEDTNRLQENLIRLSEWENTWQLKFNVSKCTVICCTRSLTTPFTHDYIAALCNCFVLVMLVYSFVFALYV